MKLIALLDRAGRFTTKARDAVEIVVSFAGGFETRLPFSAAWAGVK